MATSEEISEVGPGGETRTHDSLFPKQVGLPLPYARKWQALKDSNLQPMRSKRIALPIELSARGKFGTRGRN